MLQKPFLEARAGKEWNLSDLQILDFTKLLSQASGYANRTMQWSDSNKTVALPILERSILGIFSIGFSLPFGFYGGGIGDDVSGDVLIQSLEAVSRKFFFGLIVQNPFLERELGRLHKKRVATSSTLVMDIQGRSIEEIENKDFDADLRWSVRKACRSEVDVRVGRDRKILDDFYYLYELSSLRWGKKNPKYKRSFFDPFEASDMMDVYVAYRLSKPISAAIILKLGIQHFYWFGALDKAASKYYPQSLILREALKKASQDGVRHFNFGSSSGHAGVEKFKQSFGAKELKYGHYYFGNRMLSPLIRYAYRK